MKKIVFCILEIIAIGAVAFLISKGCSILNEHSSQRKTEERAFRIEMLLHELRYEQDSTKANHIKFQLSELGYKVNDLSHE